MRLKPLLVVWSLCALTAFGAQAQSASPSPQPTPTALPTDSLSLEEALRRVYQEHPALWRLRQEQALWSARVLQAGLGTNPEFTLSGEDFAGSAAFTSDRFTQFTLGLAQTLVLGNKVEARVRLARVQRHEVYQTYARLLTLQAEQSLLAELVANALAQHALFVKAVNAGRIAPSALLQSESQVKTLEAEALSLELQARSQRQTLTQLWGGSTPDFIQLSGELPLSGWGGWDSLQAGLQTHPRLARWELEGQQRQGALDAARAQTVPDINLSGGLRYHPPLDWGLVLSLGVPFQIANGNQGQIEEAQLRNESWQHERLLEERSLLGQLRQAYDQAQGQAQLMALLREQVTLGQAQLEAANKAFIGGKTGSLEVLLAAQHLHQLRRKLTTAQGERLLAVVEVLALTQELLPEPNPPALEVRDDLRR